VTGATAVVAGRLVVRATRVGADTQVAQLVRLVERAQADKAGVQRLADRISSYFVPAVIALSVLTATGWAVAGAPVERAVSIGLAVLIIACPCALGLATPTALMAAAGRGAQLGVFIKGHRALESARDIDTVVFDKTGTLTTGQPVVTDVWLAAGVSREDLIATAYAIEHAAEHVAARAIEDYARRENAVLSTVEEFEALPGLGARGVVAGRRVLVGSPRLMARSGLTVPGDLDAVRDTWEVKGGTTVAVAIDGVVAGAFGLADAVRPTARAAVAGLNALGLRTVVLTGDIAGSARAVAAEVGIDEVIAEVLPAEKAGVIARLRDEGRVVAMVGDGVNDAPALAGSDLGLALVTGADVAIDAADVIVVRGDLRMVPAAVLLARRTLRTIRGNLLWAFGYNVAALPIAAAGLLNPLISSAAMAASSLFVVFNSLRLRGFRPYS
jgi:heavy metal translocating P-type ATPase